MTDIPVPSVLLDDRGRRLWVSLHGMKSFSPAETLLVEEICRLADRLEVLDEEIRDGSESSRREARQQQNVLKQLVVSLRLPDATTGKLPQHRGARGSYNKAKPGTVSVLDRMRERNGA